MGIFRPGNAHVDGWIRSFRWLDTIVSNHRAMSTTASSVKMQESGRAAHRTGVVDVDCDDRGRFRRPRTLKVDVGWPPGGWQVGDGWGAILRWAVDVGWRGGIGGGGCLTWSKSRRESGGILRLSVTDFLHIPCGTRYRENPRLLLGRLMETPTLSARCRKSNRQGSGSHRPGLLLTRHYTP